MPRFVVLEHDHPQLHWDFMLEAEGVLRTWKLAAPPQAGPPIEATASFDHRLLYLEFEGPVRGNRGRVVAWDRGTYEEEAGSSADRVVVRFHGQRLRGTVTLERDASGAWLLQMA
jgi:hypothetical protein